MRPLGTCDFQFYCGPTLTHIPQPSLRVPELWLLRLGLLPFETCTPIQSMKVFADCPVCTQACVFALQVVRVFIVCCSLVLPLRETAKTRIRGVLASTFGPGSTCVWKKYVQHKSTTCIHHIVYTIYMLRFDTNDTCTCTYVNVWSWWSRGFQSHSSTTDLWGSLAVLTCRIRDLLHVFPNFEGFGPEPFLKASSPHCISKALKHAVESTRIKQTKKMAVVTYESMGWIRMVATSWTPS